MTKEYIERGAVKAWLHEEDFGTPDERWRPESEFGTMIDALPAADVVEVVRCKDCKYGRPIDKTKEPEKYFKGDCIVCECWNVVGDEPTIYIPHHFCSYGEREERG